MPSLATRTIPPHAITSKAVIKSDPNPIHPASLLPGNLFFSLLKVPRGYRRF